MDQGTLPEQQLSQVHAPLRGKHGKKTTLGQQLSEACTRVRLKLAARSMLLAWASVSAFSRPATSPAAFCVAPSSASCSCCSRCFSSAARVV
jgi:hypothetical protein